MKHADDPNAADGRRASALTIHHRTGNTEGLAAIVEEAIAASRETELVLAVLDVHRQILALLRSDDAVALIASTVRGLAERAEAVNAEQGPDIRRASQLLDAHGRDDTTGINGAVQEAATVNRGGQLFLALLDLYEHLIPELSSTRGLEWLHRTTVTFANVEGQS